MSRFLLAHLVSMLASGLTFVLLVKVLRDRRPPASTLAWGLVIVLVPYVGIPLYLLLGGTWTRSVIGSKGRLFADVPAGPDGVPFVPDRALPVARVLLSRGAPPPRPGNEVEVCPSGEVAYRRLMDMIRGARRRVAAMTFILGRDEVGRAVVEALAAKAREGVEVYLLLDALGCLGTRGRFVEPLRRAGGRVGVFLPVLPIHRRWSSNLRNHRKVAVVDDETAWVGGMNLATEYMGPTPRPDRWADVVAVVRGPAARDLAAVFAADWRFATGRDIAPLPPEPGEPEGPAGARATVQVVASGPDVEGGAILDALLAAIMAARERVWIASPYFVPDEALTRALALQARMGRDVRILVPARSNHRLADLARGAPLRTVVEGGARAFLYGPGMLHSKLTVVDDSVAFLGSANADMRSLYLNFEIGVLTYSPAEVAAVARVLEHYMAAGQGIDPAAGRHPFRWLLEDTARLLSPLL